MDSRIIRGMLVASCLLIVFAIIVTAVEILQYPAADSVGAGPAVRAVSEPAAPPPAESPAVDAEPVAEPEPAAGADVGE